MKELKKKLDLSDPFLPSATRASCATCTICVGSPTPDFEIAWLTFMS